jgi:NAD+ kinase
VATPTGTTAYNLSEGGPLVHPTVSGFVVTEMCATEPMPSLVVTPDSEVTVHVGSSGTGEAVAVGDGRRSRELEPPENVTIQRADVPIRVAGPDLDFFAALGKLD